MWAGAVSSGVSDYYLNKTLATRISTQRREQRVQAQDEEPVILLWGSLTERVFEPAFRLMGRATREDREGLYLAEGFGPDGRRVFSHQFSPALTSHGAEHFHIAVPVGRDVEITSVTITGEGVMMHLFEGSVPPLRIEFDTAGQGTGVSSGGCRVSGAESDECWHFYVSGGTAMRWLTLALLSVLACDAGNFAPLLCEGQQTMFETHVGGTISTSICFTDDSEGLLLYEAVSSDTTVVRVSISGDDRLDLRGLSRGGCDCNGQGDG